MDFQVSIIVTIIIALIRYIILVLLKSKLIFILSEKRTKTIDEANRRSAQLCKWFFDFFYYSASTISAYLILRNNAFFPAFLGGPDNGSCSNIFARYPYVPNIPYLQMFYLV